MAFETKSCILKGANGFVGSRLKGRLERGGWRGSPPGRGGSNRGPGRSLFASAKRLTPTSLRAHTR